MSFVGVLGKLLPPTRLLTDVFIWSPGHRFNVKNAKALKNPLLYGQKSNDPFLHRVRTKVPGYGIANGFFKYIGKGYGTTYLIPERRLRDRNVVSLVKVNVHSGANPNETWAAKLEDALRTGRTNYEQVQNVAHDSKYGYIGGRWLESHLRRFWAHHLKYVPPKERSKYEQRSSRSSSRSSSRPSSRSSSSPQRKRARK